MKELNAKNLKDTLWKTLQNLRAGDMDPLQAEAIASQSREIIRVVKTQQSILKQGKREITEEMINFVENVENK